MSSKTPMESSDTFSSVLEYEVFLSFRGPDTRTGFTDHLYVRLIDSGIRVYRDDDELRKGEKIGSELQKGIKQSKIAIPIFSKGYATSIWCLDELVQIVKCKRTTGLKVLPIFYNITPHEVRNQTGDYGRAFESHDKRYDGNIIKDWKTALREVGELKGWDIQSGAPRRQEGELVKEVTNVVLRELKKGRLVVTNQLVGLKHHVEEILNMLNPDINGLKILSIHGMGGIGKTTLGKVIYNHLLPHFESHCFLADIREMTQSKGLMFLQKRLISSILNVESIDFSNIDEGIEIINERFYNKKVLLILDDVDEISQLKALVGKRDRYGSRSRIIITTRNQGILDQLEVDRFYELNGLDSHQALQLFSQHAFRDVKPPKEYAILSQKIVEIAGGLPLALEVFGSLVCGKSNEKWVSMVKKLEKVPHKEIGAKLKISFEALDEKEKQMFLDIACFFIGEDKRTTVHFWDESEFPEEAIEVLQQMSLIKIQEDYSIWMHDQLKDLGREIVQQEHSEPERRSRLWNEDEGTKLLMRKMGGDNIRGINLDFQWKTEHSISNKDFARLPNLRLLHIKRFDYKWYKKVMPNGFFRKSPLVFSKLRWLSWHYFSHLFDTSNFSIEDLVILDLSYSDIKSSWSGWSRIKMAKNLKVLKLTGCDKLVKTPNFSYHLKLEQLILDYCTGLEKIDKSIGMLENLIILNLRGCRSLQKLPKELSYMDTFEELIFDGTPIKDIPNLPPMRRLRVFGCSNCLVLYKVSSLDFAANLTKLSLARTRITALPESIGNLVNLQDLFLEYCDVETLPESIGNLVNLQMLSLSCSDIVELPDAMGMLKNLKELYVDHISIRKLPTAIGMLENLITLDASCCYYLHDTPKLPQSLVSLKLMCREMQIQDLSCLTNLENLELLDCYFQLQSIPKLPPTLKDLHINDCFSLGSSLELPSGLTSLEIYQYNSLESLFDLPTSLTRLSIEYCDSLTFMDLLNLRQLDYLKVMITPFCKVKGIWSCESLQKLYISYWELAEMVGLEMLGNLTDLEISSCEKLKELPDLSNLKKLKVLQVSHCPNLVKIPGRLESLAEFYIGHCESLKRIPDIPNSKIVGTPSVFMIARKFDKSPQSSAIMCEQSI